MITAVIDGQTYRIDDEDRNLLVGNGGEADVYRFTPTSEFLTRYGSGRYVVKIFRPATTEPGFSSRADLAAYYAEVSGRDISNLDYFVALGYWKLAIILEGVYSRYVKGQYGKPEPGFEEFGKNVGRLAEAASEAVDRLG